MSITEPPIIKYSPGELPRLEKSVGSVLNYFPEVSPFPHKVVPITMHYFIWPADVDLDNFRLDDNNTWGDPLKRDLVAEQINRVLSAILLSFELEQLGYTPVLIHAAADMNWGKQTTPEQAVRKILEQMSELTQYNPEAEYFPEAVMTRPEIRTTFDKVPALLSRWPNSTLAGAVSVTSENHAGRTLMYMQGLIDNLHDKYPNTPAIVLGAGTIADQTTGSSTNVQSLYSLFRQYPKPEDISELAAVVSEELDEKYTENEVLELLFYSDGLNIEDLVQQPDTDIRLVLLHLLKLSAPMAARQVRAKKAERIKMLIPPALLEWIASRSRPDLGKSTINES